MARGRSRVKQFLRNSILFASFLGILVLGARLFTGRTSPLEDPLSGPHPGIEHHEHDEARVDVELPPSRIRPRPITGSSSTSSRAKNANVDEAFNSTISIAPGCSPWTSRPNIPWQRTIRLGSIASPDVIPSTILGTTDVVSRHNPGGCVSAFERLAPFGHLGAREEFENLPWSEVRWGSVQDGCAGSNGGKMEDTSAGRKLKRPSEGLDQELEDMIQDERRTGRTAVVLRTWDTYEYGPNHKAWLRALVTELALDTAGKFQVFLLVDVKNPAAENLLSNEALYAQILHRSVPEEFHDMAILFNDRLLQEWYPKVSNHKAKDQMYQALQIFSYSFPEFDYVWQLEMDARFTGHVGQMLEDAATWAQEQPRKNLWERNARFFIPGLWENDYAAFSASLDEEFADAETTIWGPAPNAETYITPRGPPPPPRSESTWGIDEPADLITLSPMIDPIGNKWDFENEVHNFSPTKKTNLLLPRRMAMISMTRTSRRLLQTISLHQRQTGAWLVSEATPETYAFLHGFKAVYVPHLISFNLGTGALSPKELDKLVHKGSKESLAGGKRASFLWCGRTWKMKMKQWLASSYIWWGGQGLSFWYDYVVLGKCMPQMVLHPVKRDGELVLGSGA
ncbi:hypothetical protein CB0940_05333 [Cercospora beticola]|uniref:Uncharacterized protein n=1 Tax=Cercospora beticola TaxID=122368 RepID=A0A2G5HZT0_CERBT|nr:hypothetical protein CB0940_05333 [Cercospora beticola]PIA98075.1 hypothetical protein CB0940_05333 [Cercospora beticola]WPA97870.1 hypothetical protein RHO25_002481 [Cercospora beticola]